MIEHSMTYPQKEYLIILGLDAKDLEMSRYTIKDADCLIKQLLKEKEELRKLEALELLDCIDDKITKEEEVTESWYKGDYEYWD